MWKELGFERVPEGSQGHTFIWWREKLLEAKDKGQMIEEMGSN